MLDGLSDRLVLPLFRATLPPRLTLLQPEVDAFPVAGLADAKTNSVRDSAESLPEREESRSPPKIGGRKEEEEEPELFTGVLEGSNELVESELGKAC